jgi:hypothetical protein
LEQQVEIRTILNRIDSEAAEELEKSALNPLDMFRQSHLKKTLIILVTWINVCVGSFTLHFNSTQLHGDVFLNYILAAVVGDTPGTLALIVTMKYFGRRFNLFYTQAVVGVACIILAFIPKTVRSRS